MAGIAKVARLLALIAVGGIFALAGIPKAMNPAAFAVSIDHYRLLPWWGAAALALYLPWLEILCAAALFTKKLPHGLAVRAARPDADFSRRIDLGSGAWAGYFVRLLRRRLGHEHSCGRDLAGLRHSRRHYFSPLARISANDIGLIAAMSTRHRHWREARRRFHVCRFHKQRATTRH